VATHAVFRKAEATRHLRRDQDTEAFEFGWTHVLRNIVFQTIEIFGALALFIGVIFLLIWLFD
jgi:hypothetical protein